MEPKDIKKQILASKLTMTGVMLDLMEDPAFRWDMMTNTNAYDAKSGKVAFMQEAKKKAKEFEKKSNYHDWCPFHQSEKNNHFTIYNERKYAVCYSGPICPAHKQLNVIHAVMVFIGGISPEDVHNVQLKQTKKAFMQALRYLLKKYPEEIGIDASVLGSSEQYFKSLTPEQKLAYATQRVYEDAADFMKLVLLHYQQGQVGLDYLTEERGFKYGIVPVEELIEKFKIGIAVSEKFGDDILYRRLKQKGHSDEAILASGLCRTYTDFETGEEKIRDFFLQALTMPYLDEDRKIFNYYGRSLDPECESKDRHRRQHGGVPKPNGLSDILTAKVVFIVEGELSKLSVVTLGYPHVIESRGTNGLKDDHIDMLWDLHVRSEGKYLQTIVLCMDPDDSGESAMAQTGKRLIDKGFQDVRVVRMPVIMIDGERKCLDPNNILTHYKEEAKATFDTLVNGAVSYEAFMISYTIKNASRSSAQEKRMAFRSVSEFFEKIPLVEVYLLVDEIAELLHMDPDTLRGLWVYEKMKQAENMFDSQRQSHA